MIVKTITEVLGWKQNPNLGFLKLPEVILFMFLFYYYKFSFVFDYFLFYLISLILFKFIFEL